MLNIFLILIAFLIQQSAFYFREAMLIQPGSPEVLLLTPLLSGGALLLFGAAGLIMSRYIHRSVLARPQQRQALYLATRKFAFFYKIAMLICYFAILVVLNWYNFAWRVADVFFIHVIVELAPFFVLLLVSWTVFHGLEKAFGHRKWTLRQYISFQARQAAVIIVVLLTFSFAMEVIEGLHAVEMFLTLYPEVMLISFVPIVALVYTLIPLLARFMWKVERFPDGPLRRRLEQICRRNKVKVRDILLWHTGAGSIVNAAVLGLFPGLRYVILTDGLVQNLKPEEVEAVFGHELGHAHHGHIAYYAAFLMTISFLTMYLLEPFQTSSEPLNIILQFVVTFGLFIGIVFGFISRRFERQADLFGCRVAGDARIFISALEKVAALSGNVRAMPSWMHSSIAKRVGFLAAAMQRPSVASAFQRRVRSLCAAIVVLGLGSLLFSFLRLATVPRDERISAQILRFEQMLSQTTDENERLNFYLGIGNAAEAAGDLERASANYLRFFADKPKAMRYLLRGGGSDVKSTRAEELRSTGLLFLRNGFCPTAKAMFDCALIIRPEDESNGEFARGLYAEAFLLTRRDRSDRALRYLKYAALFDPSMPDVRCEAGMIHYIRAVDLLRGGARTMTQTDTPFGEAGYPEYGMMRELGNAVRHFGAAVNLGAGTDARLLLARCCLYRGYYQWSVDSYSKLPKESLSLRDVVNFGEAKVFAGDFEGGAAILCDIAPSMAKTEREMMMLAAARRRSGLFVLGRFLQSVFPMIE